MNQPAWDRTNHWHQIDGQDVKCVNLTHCPSICDHTTDCDARIANPVCWCGERAEYVNPATCATDQHLACAGHVKDGYWILPKVEFEADPEPEPTSEREQVEQVLTRAASDTENFDPTERAAFEYARLIMIIGAAGVAELPDGPLDPTTGQPFNFDEI